MRRRLNPIEDLSGVSYPYLPNAMGNNRTMGSRAMLMSVMAISIARVNSLNNACPHYSAHTFRLK
jgi:hypothetical protein